MGECNSVHNYADIELIPSLIYSKRVSDGEGVGLKSNKNILTV